jgi:hypothetical protein
MISRKIIRAIAMTLLTLHVALVVPTIALAQIPYNQGQVQQNIPVVTKVGEGNQYYLGQANELLMRVNVWGRVERPGQYFVPATTDLITLISAAGGPKTASRLTDIAVVRPSEEGENQVILVNVKKYLKTGDKRLIPNLKPEDTVVVNGSVWQLFSDVVDIVSKLAIVANVYYFFFIAGKNN